MADDHDQHPPGTPGIPGNGPPDGVSRRTFIQTLGLSAAAGALATHQADADAASGGGSVTILGPDPVAIKLNINGTPHKLMVDPATTLLDALRIDLGLTGTKEICDRGSCGGCSVLIDGKLIDSCMMLAVDAVGTEITTIESLADGDTLHPIQESFVRHDALQCGYCTPGFVMASKALLDQNPRPTLNQIKRGLSGNLCRCGTYPNMCNAVLDASGQEPITEQGGG